MGKNINKCSQYEKCIGIDCIDYSDYDGSCNNKQKIKECDDKEKIIEALEYTIANLYEDKIGFPVSFGELNKKEKEKYNTNWGLYIWFNDMFDWALSYTMIFIISNETDLAMLFAKFADWIDNNGKEIFYKFKNIPYPPEKYTSEQLNFYFNENCKIGKELEQSINKFCNISDLNNGLK
jgi:hypothetical protein